MRTLRERWHAWWREIVRAARGPLWNQMVNEVDRAHDLIARSIERLDEESVARRTAEGQLANLQREVVRLLDIMRQDRGGSVSQLQLAYYIRQLERALPPSRSSRTRTPATGPAES